MSHKTFLLTGCASGIGKHLTGVLSRAGEDVIAADINIDGLEQAARDEGWNASRVHLRRLDVTDPDQWEEVFAEGVRTLGRIDVCMNIAGYLQSGWVYEAPLKEVERHIDINAKGVVYGSRLAAQHMVERKSGHIINIASIAGLVPVPGMALYSAAKFFVRSYSLSIAEELRPFNVHVTAICPFSVQTPLLERQEKRFEASMMFSAPALKVEDIEKAILQKALTHRPLEVWIPESRCYLARLIDFFPGLAKHLIPYYNAWGRKEQDKILSKETVKT